jgi:hypothetical protein
MPSAAEIDAEYSAPAGPQPIPGQPKARPSAAEIDAEYSGATPPAPQGTNPQNALSNLLSFINPQGAGLMRGIEEGSERFGQAMGGAMAPAFGQSDLNPLVGAYRGAVFKDQPRPAEVYERAGYKGLDPGLQAGIEAGGRLAGVPGAGSVAGALGSPEGLGFLTEAAGQTVLDPLAGVASVPLKAAGRAMAPLRELAGIRNVGSAFSRGFSIVNSADRAAIRQIFQESRGVGHGIEDFVETSLDDAERLIRDAAKQRGQNPSVTEKFVRDLTETRHRDPMLASLALPEEHAAADILQNIGDKLPEFRVAEHLRPAELGPRPPGAPPDEETTLAEVQSLITGAARERGEDPMSTFARVTQMASGSKIPSAGPISAKEGAAASLLKEYANQVGDFQEAIRKAHEAVRYTPRIAEPSLQKVLGTAGGRQITASELKPTLPGKRAVPPETTTSELEAAIEAGAVRKTPVKEPLKPLLQAFAIRGRGTARSASNARAINDIFHKFAVPESEAGKGWRSMSELGILNEYLPDARKALGSGYVHPEVFRYMDDFSKATTPPNIPVLNQFLKGWKPIVTTINPGFIGRNFEWNGIVGWIFGNRSPRNWQIAGDAMTGANPLSKVPGLNMVQGQLRNELVENGVIRSGLRQELGMTSARIERPAKTLLGKIGKGAEKAIKVPSRLGSAVNTAGEDLSRASFYTAMRRNGMSPAEAAKKVRQVYFDYSRDAFTRGENWVRENLVPFYAWTRRILPLTFRALAEHPSAFTRIGSLEYATAKSQNVEQAKVRKFGPEFEQTPGLVLPNYPGQEKGTYRAIPLNAIGFFDPSRMGQTLGEGPRAFVEQLIGAANPLLKTAYEAIWGKNTFTGRDNTGRPVRMPSWIGAIPATNKALGDKLGIVKGPDGWYAPDYLYSALSTPGPLASAIGDLYLASKGDRKAGARAIRWLTGVKISEDLSPEKTEQYKTIGEAFKTRDQARQGAKNKAKFEALTQ